MVPHPFISYAREDYAFAAKLCADLRLHGIEPWIDKEKIVAGESWPIVVRAAIRNASHVILVISAQSVAKTGYVQREVYEALDRLKSMPPGRNFIIPVRLDDTPVPYDELRNIQWVNLFKDHAAGMQNILDALRRSADEATTAGASIAASERLVSEVRDLTNVELAAPARFGQALRTRDEIYAEATRFVANAGFDDTARATATLFDRKETTDGLFLDYLELLAVKCRAAADHGGSFEHHALFAFQRDAEGQIPEGVKRGLDLRIEVFQSHNVRDRLHFYEIDQPMLDMLLVGSDRAVVAFPENPSSSRLHHGMSAVGLQPVSFLVAWFDGILSTAAVPLLTPSATSP